MRRRAARPIAAAALLGALAAGCLATHGTPDRPLVRSFDIRGTHAISSSDLMGKLATQSSGTFFWQEAHYYDRDALATDEKRILRYYQDHGYYSARIDGVEVKPAGEGAVSITIRITEGPPTRVREVRIVGMEGAPEVKLSKLPIHPGDVFAIERYDAGRSTVLSALRGAGYARAEVDQHATIDPSRRDAIVTYTARPGERYRFGNVFVAGTLAVPRAKVREEAEQAVHPGATFDDKALGEAQKRIFDLGVFGGVRVSENPPDPEKKTIPVVVAVREAPFRTIRVGPGFGFQATRWDAHLVGGWTHRNFYGGLRRLSLDARLGYAWLPNPFSPVRQGITGLLSAEFNQPEAISRIIDFNVHTEVERGLEQAFSFYAERFRLSFPFRLGRIWRFVPSYNVELYQITGQAQLTGASASFPQLLLSCPKSPCLLSYTEQQVAWDGRDNPITTRQGVYAALALQEGFELFGLGFPYLRLLPEIRGFVPIAGAVLAARVSIGLLVPIGRNPALPEDQQTPIVARFTAGGFATTPGNGAMRGYYTRMLSPVVLICTQTTTPTPANPTGCTATAYAPVGGDGLITGSLELRFGISGNLGGAAFLDFGNVTRASVDALDLSHLQYALGAGLRYNTLFGPLRLDVAARLPTRIPGGWEQPKVPVVQIDPATGNITTVGYHTEPIVAVHISLGEAF